MKTSTQISELINELAEILHKHGDMPVVSSSNEDGIFSTHVFCDVEATSEHQNSLYLVKNKEHPWGVWESFKAHKEPLPAYVLHIGSNAPVLGEGNTFVNNVKLPEVVEDPEDEVLMERQLNNVHKVFEKALEL